MSVCKEGVRGKDRGKEGLGGTAIGCYGCGCASFSVVAGARWLAVVVGGCLCVCAGC